MPSLLLLDFLKPVYDSTAYTLQYFPDIILTILTVESKTENENSDSSKLK